MSLAWTNHLVAFRENALYGGTAQQGARQTRSTEVLTIQVLVLGRIIIVVIFCFTVMPLNRDRPECLGFVFDCASSIPKCGNLARFDFPTLWDITSEYFKQCPHGPWLFSQAGNSRPIPESRIALTNDVCKAVAGSGWKRYPGADIWQLVVSSPRPPLGFWIEAFSVVHFLGDPMGTISDLLRKVESCQRRAVFWQERLEDELVLLRDERTVVERKRVWKSLAIIVDSFDEWGSEFGDRVQKHLLTDLVQLCSPDACEELRRKYFLTCLQTADALAADRSTKFLPITIAQAFFIGSVAIAMIRTESASNGPNPSTYINIEMFSIAFTAQYFWVIFTVFWTSIIGTSQTAAAIPRILGRFRQDLEWEISGSRLVANLATHKLDDERRVYEGGIYSWQPTKWRTPSASKSTSEHYTGQGFLHSIVKIKHYLVGAAPLIRSAIPSALPLFIVAAAASTGQLISGLIPPGGWSCRSDAMMWMSVTWMASYALTSVPCDNNYRFQFWITFIKDLVAVGVTFGIVIATQFGIFNRCDCYTDHGRSGLQLPFMPAVQAVLQSRLRGVYPAVVIIGIVVQLILVPGFLIWRYHAAVQVFLQRDDGMSNIDWWYIFQKWRRESQYGKDIQKNTTQSSEHDVVADKDAEASNAASFEEVESVMSYK